MSMRARKDASSASAGPIDFVITWVDGDDSAWLAAKKECCPETTDDVDDSVRRYRDWGLLRYVFRSIEQFAPWVRKVYLVTCGHRPGWLNLDAPKLEFVCHADYMPARYLPTFSSHPIELNLHRIEGLSERFVYFNDDTFILRPVSQELFFRGALPVLSPELHGILPRGNTGVMAHVLVNNTSALNRHFAFKKTIKGNASKWLDPFKLGPRVVFENLFCLQYEELPGIRHAHLPMPLLKQTIEDVWDAEPDLLEATSMHKLRSSGDVNPYLFWQWQLLSGRFYPTAAKNLGRRFALNLNIERIEKAIRNQEHPLICANDMGGLEGDEEFERARRLIVDAFESILPHKSHYER